MWFVKTTKPEAAAAARIGARLGARKRRELLALLRPCFARPEPWLQAGKYAGALASGLPKRNGQTIAEQTGDRWRDRTQRLLNRAAWDTWAAMGAVRRFAVAGLDEAARRSGRRRGLVTGALDGTGQEKQGQATAGVQRQYLGCAGRVANGINTVHLAYVHERAGHALIGSRQWIPRAQIGTRRARWPWACHQAWSSAPRGSWPSTSARMRSPTGSGSISSAATRHPMRFRCQAASGSLLVAAGECGGLVVVLAGGQAVVEAAEEPVEEVALGGGVPVAGCRCGGRSGRGRRVRRSGRRRPRCSRRRRAGCS